MSFVDELRWRGMLHDMTPEVEEYLKKEKATAYVGIDPTADSLHIGHLVSVMMLKHFQLAGHKPIVLVGGATGMIGDPSGKSEERNLLPENELRHNQQCLKTQLLKFLDFDSKNNAAEIVNNYDWMKEFSFLEFLRDVGKHLTVNYMMAKDSVQKRLETGISFTEFTYQLVQGYDFLHLFENKDCRIQMGGSDQWGNITTGTELIRRKNGGTAYAITCPLITKADGGKFGKTEQGNVWLDPKRTSPYKFYQFWLNCADEDAAKYIKIFCLYDKKETEKIINEHNQEPHNRILQKALAKDLTIRVHSAEEYENAIRASEILFGKETKSALLTIPENTLLDIFEGVPRCEVSRSDIEAGIPVIDFLTVSTNIFPSKNDARRMLKDGAVLINKEKTDEQKIVGKQDLLIDKYILIQRGKKNYHLVITVNS